MSSKEKILNTAADLIHTRGFHHTSIQDILQGAAKKISSGESE